MIRRTRIDYWVGSNVGEDSGKWINDFICAGVRRIRIERGLRVRDMASRTGIPLGSYSCLETGRYRMSLENLFRILHVLGVAIEDVWPAVEPRPADFVDDDYIRRTLEEAKTLQPQVLTLEDVLRAVAGVYAVSLEEMASPSRRRDLTEARTVAALLVKEIRHLSMVGLSRRVGRDVSSLSHCMRRLKKRIPYDHRIVDKMIAARRQLDRMEKRLRSEVLERKRSVRGGL